jgi:Dolichyl-phosphate-mannose-protein mannosyltransferase
MTRNKWVAAFFCLWIAVISYRYVTTVVAGFRSPFSDGNDIEWLTVWLATTIVMIALAVAVKRAVETVFLILMAVSILLLILSGTLAAAITVGGMLFVAHRVGKRLMLFLGLEPNSLLSVPLGLVVVALGGFTLAALQVLTPITIGTFLLCSLLAASYGVRTHPNLMQGRIRSQSIPATVRFPLLLIAPVVFLNLVWAVTPEIQFDANNYHLAVSQIYLRNHGFIDLPYFFHSYFYRLIEMLFTFALALQGPEAAKLLSFAFSLMATLAVFSLGRLAFDENTGVWAAAFFYTTPIVSWLSGTAYIDNAVAMFLTMAAIAFLRWHRERERLGWLYAASILAGAAIAAKINAALGLPVMFGIALWHLRKQLRSLAVCALLLVAVALPWYGLTYLWTDNPVLPMLNGIFKSPLWAFENRVMDANNYGIGTSPAALSRLPFSLTWNTVRFGTATPRGGAGGMLLFAFPFGLALVTARRNSAAILFTTLVLFVVLWAFSFQNVRYYVHILPIICVVGAATVLHFAKSGWTGFLCRVCFATVLIVQFPPTSMLFSIEDRFPIRAALGIETRQQFLRRALASYAGAERLNTMVKPGERVLGVDVEDVRFYLEAPLETLADSTQNTVLRAGSSLKGERLLYTLTHSCFAYVLATHRSMKNPPVWLPYIKREFLDHFATLMFSDENTVVYRLQR